MPASPPPDSIKVEEESKENDLNGSLVEKEDADATDVDVPSHRKRRRQSEKQRKKEQEREQKEREREREKQKAQKEKEAAKTPQSKQFVKLLKEIQKKEETIKNCEDEIAVIENDLREADCPRTRVMGKDRYWNRYYWFERNGMPYGGLPDSSTASAGYANGCIWVQGPDDLEREGYVDMAPVFQNEYKAKFDVTVPERKAMEEGKTSVYNARQWGYIAEPEQVDELIKWLDPRGFNELKLRKELVTFHDKIIMHMENRNKYLATAAEKESKKEESKRSSSRIRERTPEPRSYRCLQWENTMALEDLGHLHVHQPPPPRARKQTKKRDAVLIEALPERAAKSRRR